MPIRLSRLASLGGAFSAAATFTLSQGAALSVAVALTPGRGFAQTGRSPERCAARVVAPSRAIQSPESILRPGQPFGPVTQLRVDRRTGQMSYCAHGSYCYPTTGIQISNCRFASSPEPPVAADVEEDEWIYSSVR